MGQLVRRSLGQALFVMAVIAPACASTIIGLLVAWLAAQMVLGHEVAMLPRMIARQKIAVATVNALQHMPRPDASLLIGRQTIRPCSRPGDPRYRSGGLLYCRIHPLGSSPTSHCRLLAIHRADENAFGPRIPLKHTICSSSPPAVTAKDIVVSREQGRLVKPRQAGALSNQ